MTLPRPRSRLTAGVKKNAFVREFSMKSLKKLQSEDGRVGYLILYMMGAPISILLVLWLILGDNLFGAG